MALVAELKRSVLGALRDSPSQPAEDPLVKLYWNRAGVKRELMALREERFELLDKIEEHERAIVRAQEQLDGLERLLTDPLAAANAMVYFQLRHLWRIGAQRVEQFGRELQVQAERRERLQLHEAELAKRKRRLYAVAEKREGIADKLHVVTLDIERLGQQLRRMNALVRLFRAPSLKRKIAGLHSGKAMLEQKLEELQQLADRIQSEPLPELQEISLESRRFINVAVIALAQHLVVHFAENDLVSLAKLSTERAVGDMRFGDRSYCDRMVERVREKVEELKQQKTLADQVRRRADLLLSQVTYLKDSDSIPSAASLQLISRTTGPAAATDMSQHPSEAPLRVNVVADGYWDLLPVFR